MADLEDVILSSLEDAQLTDTPALADEPELEATDDTSVDVVADPAPETPVVEEVAAASVTTPTLETPTVPEKTTPKKVEEDFDKKFGLEQFSPSGRENRIPYSRVKKIAQKAVRDAKKEWETETSPRVVEFETKLKERDTKLEEYSKFENFMVTKPDEFLDRLATIPAYKPFFSTLQALIDHYNKETAGAATQTTTGPIPDGMPAPDEKLSDGSMVYSEAGLRKLLEWQSSQVESKVTKQIEDRYKPMESEWQAQQRVQAVIPQVRAQIQEARTWPLFVDNEDAIVTALKADSKLSLEGAYRKVVFPKITADRAKMKEDVLREVKSAPRSTSVSAPTSKPVAPVHSGPRELEDIIAESIKDLKR